MTTPKEIERAEELFNILSNGDQNRDQILATTRWNRQQFVKAVQTLRDILSDNNDTISVTAEPRGRWRCWMYGLRGGGTMLNPEESEWIGNRIRDLDRRIPTIVAVVNTAANGTDGRSVLGRKARAYQKHLTRAMEDVAEITSNMDG
jgi:hypothetical protein